MGCAFAVREVADQEYGVGVEESETASRSRDASAEAWDDLSLETWEDASGDAPEVSAEASDTESLISIDSLEALEEEIVSLAANHFSVNTYRLLVMIARFDRLRGWVAAGHRTCAHWLALRAKIDLVTAREHVRVARALEKLPLMSRWMKEGKLSFSQVRALTRVADPENEADLLEIAEEATAAQLERVVRGWKRGSRGEEVAWEEERHASRTLSVFPDEDGMYVVHGRLDPEVGVLLMRAIEAASDALYEKPSMPQPPEERVREAARRRADALGLLAERALAAGFGGGKRQRDGTAVEANRTQAPENGTQAGENGTQAPENGTQAGETEAVAEKAEGGVEGAACACGGLGAPISGTRAERYLVVLHVDADTLSKDREPGRSEFEDGTRVSAETARRIACDASVVTVMRAANGSILNVGRKKRTAPPAIRRAAEIRDRGCRFPGCGLRFTAAHHVEHWGDGGETSLRNTILLCHFHHRLVHEGGWTVEWVAPADGDRYGEVRFRDPSGRCHTGAM